MRDFAIHSLAILASTAFILYALSSIGLIAWNALSGRIWAGNGRSGKPSDSDRAAQELYERSLRDSHRR